MTLKKKAIANIVEKGENAGNQQFLLFQQCFLYFQRKNSVFLVPLLSANSFNSDRSRIVLVGKGV